MIQDNNYIEYKWYVIKNTNDDKWIEYVKSIFWDEYIKYVDYKYIWEREIESVKLWYYNNTDWYIKDWCKLIDYKSF